MKKKIRVIQYGVGAMGSNMVKLLQSKPDVKVVGAIDHDEAKIGRDLGLSNYFGPIAPNSRQISIAKSTGNASTLLLSLPIIVVAMKIEFNTASSAASTVAIKSGDMASLCRSSAA